MGLFFGWTQHAGPGWCARLHLWTNLRYQPNSGSSPWVSHAQLFWPTGQKIEHNCYIPSLRAYPDEHSHVVSGTTNTLAAPHATESGVLCTARVHNQCCSIFFPRSIFDPWLSSTLVLLNFLSIFPGGKNRFLGSRAPPLIWKDKKGGPQSTGDSYRDLHNGKVLFS